MKDGKKAIFHLSIKLESRKINIIWWSSWYESYWMINTPIYVIKENKWTKIKSFIYIYLFVVYARNARTHKSGPREAQMFASNFCAHFVLVTISDLKIKLHILYVVLIVGNVLSFFFHQSNVWMHYQRKKSVPLFISFDVIKSKKLGWWIVFTWKGEVFFTWNVERLIVWMNLFLEEPFITKQCKKLMI